MRTPESRNPTSALFFLAFGMLCGAHIALAGPGDEVTRIVPTSCGADSSPKGVAFDGELLYYSQNHPFFPEVYVLDAATGADRGSFPIRRGGAPTGEHPGGLTWDPNRGVLWTGVGGKLLALDPASGEVILDVFTSHAGAIEGLAYDDTRDQLWESTGPADELACVRPEGSFCGSVGSSYGDSGLSFDGLDLWHYSTGFIPPGVTEGWLFPTDLESQSDDPDTARMYDIPGKNYWDIAYDCTTFDVPVLWVAHRLSCTIFAFEVESNIPCRPAVPEARLLRSNLLNRAELDGALPLTTPTASRVFHPARPLAFEDDLEQRALLSEVLLYQLVGPDDTPAAAVLKLTGNPAPGEIIVHE